MKKVICMLLLACPALGQPLAPLTVEMIMRDPKWMGVAPSNIYWSEDSKQVYFNWNPERNPGDSLYVISVTNRTPQAVPPATRKTLAASAGEYNKSRTKKAYEKNGDLFMLDIVTGKATQITNTIAREFNPAFSSDEKRVIFMSELNLFAWDVTTGAFSQLTDFKRGNKKSDARQSEQEKWLNADQLAYFEVLRQRSDNKKAADQARKKDNPRRPKEIWIEDKNIDNLRLTPDENFITYRLIKMAGGAKNTVVPNYVTESGFTTDIPSRTKVGSTQNSYEFFVYDIRRDTVLSVKPTGLDGIMDTPDYKKDYQQKPTPSAEKKNDKKESPTRPVIIHGPTWSPDGKYNVVTVRSQDNKDRWLASLDPATQKLTQIDRQRDEAWIGGPGTGGFFGAGQTGWVDGKTFWFISEESGYSHLYAYDFASKKKTALTSGKYEVQEVTLSKDKKSFYLSTNEVHPGEKQFSRIPVTGGKGERITSLTGNNDVALSPDEKWLAIRYSYSNRPWELYLQENKVGAKPVQVTNSLSEEFKSYQWRDPQLVTVKARDGADIYARLFKPARPNGAAVIFVHGAGYLQNAHKWWSQYFREYMFHNLLADRGYTVLDLDYRASAGYGRDWRTGIYRFMGGKDLTDNVDGAKWLVDQHGIDSKRIGIYGGSYGGFITLMAMFTTPDVFAAGAALRPVTDWAHYNHSYTSNILNEPFMDSLSYAKSSPLYYAEGLKGHLLICHGMVDVNVHFQDAVRLSQRLIELGKDNWELAAYPVEDHAFVEPSSWTDEYKRILKLFDRTIGENSGVNGKP
jgi:dipeptidyl aminopeptidase/acylaminoacyl peptidase